MNCAGCGLPLNPTLAQLGENTHATCDDPETYCHPTCPDGDCCLKAATFRPIRDVPVGERL